MTSLYSLSCDIAGPFRAGQGWDPIASGRDRGHNYKYFLSFAFSVPVSPRELQPELTRPEEGLDYSPSEAEDCPEAIGASVSPPSKAEQEEDFDSLLERLDQEATGGLSLKALFRRMRGKSEPVVEPTGKEAEFASPVR